MHTPLILSLGSNLGDRYTNLLKAKNLLQIHFGSTFINSDVYVTEPWGVDQQPDYYNMVIAFSNVTLTPAATLAAIQKVEDELGRVRPHKWAPRLIDIDILFMGDLVYTDNELEIPHPLLHLRKFVLIPLAQILPYYEHPLLRKKIVDLLNECADNSNIYPLKV